MQRTNSILHSIGLLPGPIVQLCCLTPTSFKQTRFYKMTSNSVSITASRFSTREKYFFSHCHQKLALYSSNTKFLYNIGLRISSQFSSSKNRNLLCKAGTCQVPNPLSWSQLDTILAFFSISKNLHYSTSALCKINSSPSSKHHPSQELNCNISFFTPTTTKMLNLLE